MVWQDNMTDGDGLGISAQRLNANLSATLGTFRVNEQGAGDQENAKVAMLKNGGAVFAWQGGKYGFQRIYARFLAANGTFATGDILVNTYTNSQQINPAVAALPDGNAVVVWSSFGQDGSLQGVYGQRLSATGQKLGAEFAINQTTSLNQRTPAVSALANGSFVVAWISEKFRGSILNTDPAGRIPDRTSGVELYDVGVFARLYDPSGKALGNEFQINTHSNVCANPAVSGAADGGFAVVWSERVGRLMTDGVVRTNGWDISLRSFDARVVPNSVDRRVNTETYGDQFAPKISAVGSDYLAVWTSLGQDGSREGVYGQLIVADGNLTGSEFRVNTTTVSQQFQPVVASDNSGRFIVVWSSFVGGMGSFDLFAQRYAVQPGAQPLSPPAAPYVSALSQSRLSVTWPELAGYSVDHYELYVDDKTAPVLVAGNMYVNTQLAPGTLHTLRLAYKLTDGRVSALSDAVTATTWGDDTNFDGLPDDWQARFWGNNPAYWPAPNLDSDGDGATNLQEFLAGTDPKDPNSVLRTSITSSRQGRRLNWNTQPGLIYQVQTTVDFTLWTNLGSARFAVGKTDSLPIDGGKLSIYRVIRVR